MPRSHFLNAILPGTPYTNAEKLSPEQIALLNEQAGLDKPMITQYGLYLTNLVKGDFGISFQFKNQPVANLLSGRIGPSLQLGLQAIILGLFRYHFRDDLRYETKYMD